MNIILTILLFVALSIHAQTVPSSNLSGLGGSGAANTGGQTNNTGGGNATTQNQQGGSVATLTATTINNGYSQGRPIRVGGTSVRLNLRLLPQQRQQITTYRQYRISLRLGRHGYIQPNNNTQTGSNTQTGNNGSSNNNSSGGGSNSGTGSNNTSGQGNQTNQQGEGGVTPGGSSGGGETPGGSSNGGTEVQIQGMQAQGSVRK